MTATTGKAQRAVGGHGPEPDDARRRLLGPGEDLGQLIRPLLVEERHEVAAVVHRDVRMRVRDRVEVRVVRVAILAASSERADPVARDERGRDVVLRRERVRRGERHVRSARRERPHEVGRLGRHVEAGGDAQALERPLAREALADEPQDRHLPLGPFDAADAFVGEAQVGDVVRRERSGLAGVGVTGDGLHRIGRERGSVGHPVLRRSGR